MGYLLLEGGAEFGGGMSKPDLRGIALAGGLDAHIAILPTAAAPDQNHERAGRNGVMWFRSLGATRVDLVPVIDKSSASELDFAMRLRSAHFIYLLGGFPGYLVEVLRESLVWQAALEAYEAGAVIGGSSAGAMVLCEHYYDPEVGDLKPGLNLMRNACVLPHHDGFGKSWSGKLAQQIPEAILIGIDEQTGILNDGGDIWTNYGAGKVTLYRHGQTRIYAPEETFRLGNQ